MVLKTSCSLAFRKIGRKVNFIVTAEMVMYGVYATSTTLDTTKYLSPMKTWSLHCLKGDRKFQQPERLVRSLVRTSTSESEPKEHMLVPILVADKC